MPESDKSSRSQGTSGAGRRYLLVTPCRDEQDYLPITIESVAKQSVLPARWVIVDDGSTDRTPAILKEASERYPFIQVVHRAHGRERAVGRGVVHAFNDTDRKDNPHTRRSKGAERTVLVERSSLESGLRWRRIRGRVRVSGENGGISGPARLKDERERGARGGRSLLAGVS
ncbi:MAG: glycosyltransferase family A protein [Gammaproteobacteria bacterium]|nr:glycosyltransferase family A protein [Gammaproteobacteria bacterium]